MLTSTHMGLLPDHLVQVKNPIVPFTPLPPFSPFLLSQKCNADAIMSCCWFLKGSASETPPGRLHGGDPSQVLQVTFPFVLPLSSEEQFNEAETALKEETIRRKMVSNCLFCHRNIVHIANLQVQKALKESFTPKMTPPPKIDESRFELEFNSMTNGFSKFTLFESRWRPVSIWVPIRNR